MVTCLYCVHGSLIYLFVTRGRSYKEELLQVMNYSSVVRIEVVTIGVFQVVITFVIHPLICVDVEEGHVPLKSNIKIIIHNIH